MLASFELPSPSACDQHHHRMEAKLNCRWPCTHLGSTWNEWRWVCETMLNCERGRACTWDWRLIASACPCSGEEREPHLHPLDGCGWMTILIHSSSSVNRYSAERMKILCGWGYCQIWSIMFIIMLKGPEIWGSKTPYFWTQNWTQAWRLVSSWTRRSFYFFIFMYENRQDLLRKWCHISTISSFHALDLDPSVNSLGPNFTLD